VACVWVRDCETYDADSEGQDEEPQRSNEADITRSDRRHRVVGSSQRPGEDADDNDAQGDHGADADLVNP